MKKRHARTRRARAQEFTLIDVVVAMGVMVIGTMAIIGLQQQTVAVNSLARQRSVATQIAQTWIERLKQDALTGWTQVPDPTVGLTAATVIAGTQWLSAVNAAPNVFQPFPLLNVNASNAFDFRGNELPPVAGGLGAANAWFCVSFRPAWVFPGHALRVDVRVFWPRPRRGAVVVNCVDNGAALSPGGALFDQFSTVYLSTVIKHTVP